MKIQIASDLHLDQMKNLGDYKKIICPKSDVLVLAGDVCHIENIHIFSTFFQYINDNFHYVIYVPGNHEFYNKKSLRISDMSETIQNFLSNYKNIIYLNNRSVLIEDILFSGSCLWCCPSINPPPWFDINIDKDEINKMHKESIKYLNKVSSIKHNKHLIITHYPPIPINNIKYSEKKDKYKEYYTNKNIWLEYSPKYWIFGHTHNNFYQEINDTIYISNQRKDKIYKNDFTINL